jgi:hypothetical protein
MSNFVGVIIREGAIVALIIPDKDSELDNPNFNSMGEMVKVPRETYEAMTSMEELAAYIEQMS